MKNEFEMQCRIQEAKGRIASIAKTSKNFADFEYDVLHDKAVLALVPLRVVKILIQQHAHLLD